MVRSRPTALPNPEGAQAPLRRIVTWSPDKRYLVLADDGFTGISVVDFEAWRVVLSLQPGEEVRFTPDGRRLVQASIEPPFRIRILGVDGGVDSACEIETCLPARGLALSADGTRLAFTDNHDILVYAIGDEPELRWKMPDPGFGDYGYDFSIVDDRLVALSTDVDAQRSHVLRWDLNSTSPEAEITSLEADPRSRSILVRDGSALLRLETGVDGASRLQVHDIPGVHLIQSIDIPGPGRVNGIAATCDASTLVLEVGPANGNQQLVFIRGFVSAPRLLTNLDWRITFLTVSEDGRTVLFCRSGSIHRLELPPSLAVV